MAKIVDSHCHVGIRKGIWGDKRNTPGDQIRLMDGCGIDHSFVFSPTSGLLSASDFAEGNDYVAEAVRMYPGRFTGFAVVNPMFEEEALREIERCVEQFGLRGIKLHPVLHGNYPVDGSYAVPVVEKAVELDLAVMIHTDFNQLSATPYRVASLARKCPKAKLIMGHMGIDPMFCLTAAEIVRGNDNVLMELSAIPDSPDLVRETVSTVGEDRVLFGSDAPGLSPEIALYKIRLARLSPSAEEKILGLNALRLVNGT